MKVTILKHGEIKLEKDVKNQFEKGVFLRQCAKIYGKGFSDCEIKTSIEDKKIEKSNFKKGETVKKYHIPKPTLKTFYDHNK